MSSAHLRSLMFSVPVPSAITGVALIWRLAGVAVSRRIRAPTWSLHPALVILTRPPSKISSPRRFITSSCRIPPSTAGMSWAHLMAGCHC
ncbi:hypothetical protein PR202_ga09881 [Eleusine coracana subsp. coracana]|uniref:Secreted protein n=1 Tax=Eleusine coracana subsp. coracana TaxID=191504 RepID=A0AAV5C530_ELECO|nr:hypothetical protein PR202_ga09881 [Eleusine coracana subsp. coracana]